VELQVVVYGEVERVTGLLSPGDEGLFPVGELADLRSLERDAAALYLITALIGVDAVPAVAGVGVVRVSGELKGCMNSFW
jgi:hypothetical protein